MSPEKQEMKPDECDGCHFKTDALKRYDDRIAGITGHQETLWLCELCEATHAGTAARWPEQYRESGRVMQTICYVGNVVLAELRRSR